MDRAVLSRRAAELGSTVKILERHKTWIHTHFLTDCVRLPGHQVRDVQSRMGAFTRSLGIVFGIHFEEHTGGAGIRIVLECIPFPDTLDLIQAGLRRIVGPIPARPRTVVAIGLTAPKEDRDQENERFQKSASRKEVPARGRHS